MGSALLRPGSPIRLHTACWLLWHFPPDGLRVAVKDARTSLEASKVGLIRHTSLRPSREACLRSVPEANLQPVTTGGTKRILYRSSASSVNCSTPLNRPSRFKYLIASQSSRELDLKDTTDPFRMSTQQTRASNSVRYRGTFW